MTPREEKNALLERYEIELLRPVPIFDANENRLQKIITSLANLYPKMELA